MSSISQLADAIVGSQLNSSSNNNSDEELVPFSTLKKELEEILFQRVEKLIGPILGPMIRRIVKEQIEFVEERTRTSMNQDTTERPNFFQPRKLQLRFGNKISLPVLTGKHICGEGETALKIELFDEDTNEIVENGPEASAEVEVVVLRTNGDDRKKGSEMFDDMIVRQSDGNKSLLIGDARLNLKQGVGVVGKISFAHRSTHMKKSRFMLGAKIVNKFDGIIVGEAKSEAFILEDCRNKLYAKHHPPTLCDHVYRLINIGKGGSYEERLKKANINTVKDILEHYFKDRRMLKEILVGMTDNILDATIAHALTCKQLEDYYIYYIPGSQQQLGVVFNIVRQVIGLYSNCHFIPMNHLSETQKGDAKASVAYAFEHWGDVVRYNDHSLSRGSIYPIVSSVNAVSSNLSPNILGGTSHINDEHDNTKTNTLSPIGSPQTSAFTFSSSDNFQCVKSHSITGLEGITPLDDVSKSFTGKTIEVGDPGPYSAFVMELDAMENLFGPIWSSMHYKHHSRYDPMYSIDDVPCLEINHKEFDADRARKRKRFH